MRCIFDILYLSIQTSHHIGNWSEWNSISLTLRFVVVSLIPSAQFHSKSNEKRGIGWCSTRCQWQWQPSLCMQFDLSTSIYLFPKLVLCVFQFRSSCPNRLQFSTLEHLLLVMQMNFYWFLDEDDDDDDLINVWLSREMGAMRTILCGITCANDVMSPNDLPTWTQINHGTDPNRINYGQIRGNIFFHTNDCIFIHEYVKGIPRKRNSFLAY